MVLNLLSYSNSNGYLVHIFLQHVGNIKNAEVVSLQVIPNSEVIVACSDGTLWYFDAKHQVVSLNRDAKCSVEHGGIVKVHYCIKSHLLIVAFEIGRVHIRNCTNGLKSHFAWRESCLSLSDAAMEVFDLECLLIPSSELESCPVFEVWLGVDSDRVEVWRMPLSPSQVWASDTVSQMRAISHVKVSGGGTGEEGGQVRQVRKSVDESMLVVVLYHNRKTSVDVAIIGVTSKQCLRIFSLETSGDYFEPIIFSPI